MKAVKTLSLIAIYLFLSGCASINEKWSIDQKLFKSNTGNLQIGDIVITSKDWKNPMSWFGHSAVMVSKYIVGEYPEPCYGYYETDIILWLRKKKDFTALRYKNFDDKFKKTFLNNLPETKNKEYKITNKTDNSSFYCSQYIWHLYWKTAKDLGYELDIDRDGGYFVTPYDLLNSNYFNKVDF
ncbi:MAG: hypothetical protein K0U08_00965 [Proteobacteria bacterium]|nr:hypothetical protein [Pseudomonadota bacterium]MCH9711711.1 hypothetical protein [Pseudomonadota bacterium]